MWCILHDSIDESFIPFFFNRFFDMVVSFPIHNVRIAERNRAECFTFDIKVLVSMLYMLYLYLSRLNYFFMVHLIVYMCT